MAGLFGRLKIWQPGEDLTASDLNAEFNHFLSNIDAEHAEGYSSNLSEMQTTENPGGIGSENLTQPISIAQELQRLRYTINRIVGLQEWYQAPSLSLEDINSFIDQIASIEPSRIVSGKTTTVSDQPNFVRADGSNGVYIDAATTDLVYHVDGPMYTLSSNAVLAGLTPAPSTNNLTYLSGALLGDQDSKGVTEFRIGDIPVAFTGSGLDDLTESGTSLYAGAITFTITISATGTPDKFDWTDSNGGSATNVNITGAAQLLSNGISVTFGATTGHTLGDSWTFTKSQIGSEISSRYGLLSAFKIVNGGNTEYFIGTPLSSGYIRGIPRGFLFGTAGTSIPGIALTFDHTITVLKIAFLFIRSDGTLDITYNPFTIGPVAPSLPSANDYWYDTVNNTWKKYSGGSFTASQAAFAGLCMQDSTGNVVASRSADVAGVYSNINSLTFDTVTTNSVSTESVPLGFGISAYGFTNKSILNRLTVTMPTNLYPGETETASTNYWVYFGNNQQAYFSAQAPVERPDIFGQYHPAEALRAVAKVFNNSSSDFDASSLVVIDSLNIDSFDGIFTWEMNGAYKVGTYVDAPRIAPFDLEVLAVYIYSGTGGSSGSTEIDILVGDSGGSYSSILSVTGEIDSTAADNVFTDSGVQIPSQTGVTKPTVSNGSVNAGQALRVDILSAMSGANDFKVEVIYKKR